MKFLVDILPFEVSKFILENINFSYLMKFLPPFYG